MSTDRITIQEINDFIRSNGIDIEEVTIEDCVEVILFKLIVEQQKQIQVLTDTQA